MDRLAMRPAPRYPIRPVRARRLSDGPGEDSVQVADRARPRLYSRGHGRTAG